MNDSFFVTSGSRNNLTKNRVGRLGDIFFINIGMIYRLDIYITHLVLFIRDLFP